MGIWVFLVQGVRWALFCVDVLLTRLWFSLSPRMAETDMMDKTVIVTGATGGIGAETAIALALRGARVVMAVRNVQKADSLVHKWLHEFGDAIRTPPEVLHLDLGDLASVGRFSELMTTQDCLIHALVLNAGVFNMGCPRRTTVDGHEVELPTPFQTHTQ